MATYTLISSVTVGSGGAADIEFTSIPATYTDLVIKASLRHSSATTDMGMRFNGNSDSVYSMRALLGNGSAASSANESSETRNWLGTVMAATASTFNNMEIYIPNYTSANAKSSSVDSVNEANQTEARAALIAELWNPATQAAITSIKIYPNSGTFVQYSTAYLYGISNA